MVAASTKKPKSKNQPARRGKGSPVVAHKGASKTARQPTPRPTKATRTTAPGKKVGRLGKPTTEVDLDLDLDPITAPDRSAPPMAEVDGDALEFIEAIDRFKKQHGRPFPSWSEVLMVLRDLGYKRS